MRGISPSKSVAARPMVPSLTSLTRTPPKLGLVVAQCCPVPSAIFTCFFVRLVMRTYLPLTNTHDYAHGNPQVKLFKLVPLFLPTIPPREHPKLAISSMSSKGLGEGSPFVIQHGRK